MRSGKFYRKNEREVIRALGLHPTPNSGSGWVVKEDGQSDDVICQLKSTDKGRITIDLQDLQTLEYNGAVAHKLPVFAIQYLQGDQLYLVLKPEVVQDVAKYLRTGTVEDKLDLGIDIGEDQSHSSVGGKVIRSSSASREAFREEIENKYKRERKSAL